MTLFSQLPVHPALAAAIARRKYETATSVQAAVVADAVAERDLLVSSQTGSGKTIAFGLVIARTILPPAGPLPREKRTAPRVLVIAPTRELAAQVRRELQWLFHDAHVRITAVTGGTDIVPDLRTLRAGVDMVVGTPGRLVDLQKRGALDLSGIQVLVLDEADEMLDLGFREDLEFLLGHAPAERRTLLFSATLPREIQALAGKFQRDAVRVDPRATAPAAEQGHSDITYVAHLVPVNDRLAAVVNVLLAAGEARAIVFCRTREGVGRLHQHLVDRGFRATPISGERAQGERDRALEALRSGRSRILVATNVAARGLDLPEVEIVLHADLPENADSLTHRSGRTGRAGRKGTSIVIADLLERRRAERLLAAARIRVPWTPAPSQDDLRRKAVDALVQTLLEDAKAPGMPIGDSSNPIDRLHAALPERVLSHLLLRRELARVPAGMPIAPVDIGRNQVGRAPDAAPAPAASGGRGRPPWQRAGAGKKRR